MYYLNMYYLYYKGSTKMSNIKDNKDEIFNPNTWGLNYENVFQINNIYRNLFRRFRKLFVNKKDMNLSKYANYYIKGLMLLKNDKKTISEIARRVIHYTDDGQNLQHFITDSDWAYKNIFEKIQNEIGKNKDLSDGMIILDDTGNRKYGSHSIGVSKQYIGREGKIENGQVCVSLGYYKKHFWTMIEADLYIPEKWFNNYTKKELYDKWHVPYDRVFKTKTEIGLDLVKSSINNGLSFSVLAFDTWFGRDSNFRYDLDDLGVTYIAKIPSNSSILSDLDLKDVPDKTIEGDQYLLFPNNLTHSEIKDIIKSNDFQLKKVEVRDTERGILYYDCFCKRVKSKVSTRNNTYIDECLLVYKNYKGDYHFSVSNTDYKASLLHLCQWNAQEYFIERIFEDCKSNIGFTDLECRKYRSYMHHVCLVALCSWFICLVKIFLSKSDSNEDKLKSYFDIQILPKISISNIIDLLCVLMPLKNLSLDNMLYIVVSHLIHRSNSISSKYRKQIKTIKYSGS